MNDDGESGTGLVEFAVTALVGSAAAWSAAQVESAWVAAAAALAGVLLALAGFGLAARGRRRFRLPSFAVPSFPPADPIRDPGVVVPLRRTPRLPTPGELDQRIRAHLDGRQQTAEVIPLKVDASAALHDALIGLRDARR
ncbi:hypothetical protein OMW55_13090 [Sphingomonas sp. BN140010]|uniref:Uncharacterized protein n=1 Tax=Sphingomonas arvum TaxID=2992113 RepID=A0ABT3JI44_9SPHN|nr:hypothetical protein [Sphingomonas sp. BN140010]MCW3798744.1 hypothetical protein [Sphingomonas sp. BN140010]